MLVLVTLALAGGIAAGAAPSHAHGDVPGLYNQEHDLTAFATLASAATLAEATGALFLAPFVSAAPALPLAIAPARAFGPAASRAPPRA